MSPRITSIITATGLGGAGIVAATPPAEALSAGTYTATSGTKPGRLSSSGHAGDRGVSPRRRVEA